jgi:hypothetical protein
MSYENTECPCGGTKERETIICQACRLQFAEAIELDAMDNLKFPMETRRSAAIRVLAMARKRNKRLAFTFKH